MLGLSPKQIKSIKESTARINIWEGAVRSGKTFSSLIRFLGELATGPKGDYVIVCRTAGTFKRNIYSLLQTLVGIKETHFSHVNQYLKIYGQTVHVIGADDESAESKLRGATFLGAYVDEATIIPESAWNMLIGRCAMGSAKIFATTNPDSPLHWLKTNFLENNPDVKSWQFNFEDNPELSQDDKEYLKRQYHGVWYKRYIEGLWVQAEGSVYDFFDPSIYVVKDPPDTIEHYIVGIDYGTTNPCCFLLIGIDRRRFTKYWVAKEYYFDSKAHQRQKSDAEYAEDLKKFIYQLPVKAIYLDPSAVSFRMELRKSGIENIFEANNDVLDGIRFTSQFMTERSLKIAQDCTNTIKEIQSYCWDAKASQKGIERPLKQNDHAMDALRYAIFTHFKKEDKNAPSAEDWERIYNETRQQGPNLPQFFRDDHYRF